jgi:hypothetical protein
MNNKDTTTTSGSSTMVFEDLDYEMQESLEEIIKRDTEISLEYWGESVEKKNIDFIQKNFPKYEEWWKQNVVPITNRPNNIHFKTESELHMMGKGYADIMLAQMSYTVLIHLISLNKLISDGDLNHKDNFYEFFSRASALIDVTCDFCVIRLDQTLKSELDSKPNLRVVSIKINKQVKEYSHLVNDFSLVEPIKTYRNSLLHGVMPPSLNGQYPILDKISVYEDWRFVTDPQMRPSDIENDFDSPQSIAENAFEIVLNFLNSNW